MFVDEQAHYAAHANMKGIDISVHRRVIPFFRTLIFALHLCLKNT